LYLVVEEGFNAKALRQMIKAIPSLYSDIFYLYCRKENQFNDNNKRIEHLCIMWWDIDIWIYILQKNYPDQFTHDFAMMFETVLELQHFTTQYSILHGLGHFHMKSKLAAQLSEQVIECALERKIILPSLIGYAEQAKTGMVQ